MGNPISYKLSILKENVWKVFKNEKMCPQDKTSGLGQLKY